MIGLCNLDHGTIHFHHHVSVCNIQYNVDRRERVGTLHRALSTWKLYAINLVEKQIYGSFTDM